MSTVKLEGNYFSVEGKPFFALGVNYVPAVEAMQWPYEWNPEMLEADFRLMHEMGLNLVRLDLLWAWFEPRPGQYNEEAFAQLDKIISLAHKYGLYLNPVFFIGGEVGDAYWDVPWRDGRHPHADADMIRLQVEHVKEFARRYESEPAILAWDLTDEPPLWLHRTTTTDSMAINWTRNLCAALRQHDPQHLIVVGTAGEETGRGPFRAWLIAKDVDFFSVHPYPFFNPDLYPDPFLSLRSTYSAAFETMISRGAGKPVMVQEFGASSAQFTPERIGRYYNTLMYSALANGANGLVAWCFTDADERIWKKPPYIRCPHETQFGVTDAQKRDRPAGIELRRLSRVLAQMNLEGIKLPPLEAGIIVPFEYGYFFDSGKYGLTAPNLSHYVSAEAEWRGDKFSSKSLVASWLNAFILARQAHITVGFPLEYDTWKNIPLILMPSPLTSAYFTVIHPHTSFWRRAQSHAEAGGTLYVTLSADAAVPNPVADDLFGAALDDRITPHGEVEIEMTEDFHGLIKGERFRYRGGSSLQDRGYSVRVGNGQVIAVDQQGNPALVTHQLGKGQTLLCTYPVEHYLSVTPAAYEGDELTWRLYRALRSYAGVTSLFDCNDPRLELGVLPHQKDGYLIVVNHSFVVATTDIISSLPLAGVSELAPGSEKPLQSQDNRWEIQLGGFNGKLYHYKLR